MGRGPHKGLKRSGRAMVDYCRELEWRPQAVFLGGVGLQCKEVEMMNQQWPEVPMIGWEPHPASYAVIAREFPGALFDFGLAREEGERVLHNRRLHKNGASLCPRIDQSDTEKHTVDVDSLDNQINLLGDRDSCLLWLDCEGSELEILQGGQKFIEKGIVMINVEMTGRSEHEGWPSPERVHLYLRGLGFVHVWTHSIRPPAGQYDAIYLRSDMVDDTLRIW